ncbi:hypothetical protein C5167_022065 [Papaver somniferum]|uniref:Uncharacterized protein n=1 Tax=Papaver somniferum TaxID=3469 RepID=A0A4Y7JKM4_PAPSO|nr:hypothetical protein C5167_022065 [Papaver somniferum]
MLSDKVLHMHYQIKLLICYKQQIPCAKPMHLLLAVCVTWGVVSNELDEILGRSIE